MQPPSRTIDSTQIAAHPGLLYFNKRYWGNPYRQPIREYSRRAFDHLDKIVSRAGVPLVVDAGCGTGESTLRLAAMYLDCLVIGADKSAARLRRQQMRNDIAHRDNTVFIRTNLVDFWRQLREAGWPVVYQYLLYPNPWPKPGQVKRRWHAHPVFSDLLALADGLEMRCNWAIYAEEFAQMASQLTGHAIRPEPYRPDQPLSPFERKYHLSGHKLFRCRVTVKSNLGKNHPLANYNQAGVSE